MCFFVIVCNGGDGDGKIRRYFLRLPLAINDMDGKSTFFFALTKHLFADGFQQGATNAHGSRFESFFHLAWAEIGMGRCLIEMTMA